MLLCLLMIIIFFYLNRKFGRVNFLVFRRLLQGFGINWLTKSQIRIVIIVYMWHVSHFRDGFSRAALNWSLWGGYCFALNNFLIRFMPSRLIKHEARPHHLGLDHLCHGLQYVAAISFWVAIALHVYCRLILWLLLSNIVSSNYCLFRLRLIRLFRRCLLTLQFLQFTVIAVITFFFSVSCDSRFILSWLLFSEADFLKEVSEKHCLLWTPTCLDDARPPLLNLLYLLLTASLMQITAVRWVFDILRRPIYVDFCTCRRVH